MEISVKRLSPLFDRIGTSIVLTSLLLVCAPAASALEIYTYTGNPFTNGGLLFSTTDRVTGFMSFADPLTANLHLAAVEGSTLDWAFSAGPVAWHKGDANLTSAQIYVSTDADGNILGLVDPDHGGWLLGFTGTPASIYQDTRLASQNLFAPGNVRQVTDSAAVPTEGAPFAQTGSNSNSAGSWSKSAPEPSTLSLLALRLAVLSTSRRWRHEAA